MDLYIPPHLQQHRLRLGQRPPAPPAPPPCRRIREGVCIESASDLLKPARGQTRRGSLVETIISTAVGFLVSLAIGYWLFPKMFHTDVSHETNILITAIFTGASVARGYVMRRVFNWLHCR